MAKTGPKPRPPEERFWKHVAKAGEDDCWLWTGSKLPAGYGTFGVVPKRPMLAHRFAWELAHGEKPTLHVLHKCDNPSCVNPKHLFLGTNEDNIADRVAKGRSVSGDKHWRHNHRPVAKLKEEDVVKIREAVASGMSYTKIGERFGVTGDTVSNIARGKTWRNVK